MNDNDDDDETLHALVGLSQMVDSDEPRGGSSGSGGGGGGYSSRQTCFLASTADGDEDDGLACGFRTKVDHPTSAPPISIAKYRAIGARLANSLDDDAPSQPRVSDMSPSLYPRDPNKTEQEFYFKNYLSMNSLLSSAANNVITRVIVDDNGQQTQITEKKEVTHTNMCGGAYTVPMEKHKEFLRKVVETLGFGHQLCIGERANEQFPMFFDVDFKFLLDDLTPPANYERLSNDDMQKYVDWVDTPLYCTFISLISPIIRELVRWYDPANLQDDDKGSESDSSSTTTTTTTRPKNNVRPNLKCIVLASERTPWIFDPKTATKYVRVGYHVVFPFLIVNRVIAHSLRNGCVAALRRLIPELPRPNTWEDSLDAGVYDGGAHLRLPFVFKAHPCAGCKPSDPGRSSCQSCRGSGYKNENRRYLLSCCFQYDSRRKTVAFDSLSYDIYARDHVRLMHDVSIRRFNAVLTPNFAPYRGAPRFVDGGGDDKAIGRGKKAYVARDSPVWRELERLVHEFDPLYARVRVRDIITNASTSFYKVVVDGEGAHFCHNVMRDHGSNSVFFFVSRKTQELVQKCWSQKKTLEGRTFGVFCSDFESRPVPLNPTERLILFPHSESHYNGGQYLDVRTFTNNLLTDKRSAFSAKALDTRQKRARSICDFFEETMQEGALKTGKKVIESLTRVQSNSDIRKLEKRSRSNDFQKRLKTLENGGGGGGEDESIDEDMFAI